MGSDLVGMEPLLRGVSDLIQAVEQVRVEHVQCMFDPKAEGQLATLAKGQAVTVSGTVDNKMLSRLQGLPC